MGVKKEIIAEKIAIEGLSDGSFYVISSDRSSNIIKSVSKARNNLYNTIDNSLLFYQYDVKPADCSSFSNSNIITDKICDGANVIIPLRTPNTTNKHYLISTLNNASIEEELEALIWSAEKISRASIQEALFNLAINEPLTCCTVFQNLFSPNESNLGYSESPFTCYTIKSSEDISDNSPIPNKVFNRITYKESCEIFNRFVENCNLIKKAEKKNKFSPKFESELKAAQTEVDFVFNMIWGADKNMDSLRKMILNQSDRKLKESYDNLLNRERIALTSNLKVCIEESKLNKQSKRKNDGKYLIYVTNGVRKSQIHFSRKPSCIVYIMYLLDKVQRGAEVDTLRIINNRELFCRIYSEVYDNTGMNETFDALTSKIILGKVRQTRLKDCYLDIRHSFEEAIKEYGEELTPFIIPNENSHLTILGSNIIIPSVFEDMKFHY